MATTIRPELSTKNKYHIDKHRYYELKHFCLQYKTFKKTYEALNDLSIATSSLERFPSSNVHTSLTEKCAIRKAYYGSKIKIIEKAAMDADEYLYEYILRAVTENLSYTYLKTQMNIPCSRDTYYDRYRKFFWILSEIRD